MLTVNAENKILGRIACEIAIVILGKHKPDYVPYKITGDKIHVTNVNKIKLSGDKLEQKVIKKHTGYIGHLKTRKIKEFSKKELLERAVWYMLPKNKLREGRMKLLSIA